ncbi:helix-turn-helix transcriptional regulator [Amycolatopsis sp. CFH S0078]|uniref:helix-turn-helix domain-containing protein n=1 Tax=Amycolatopsis sp. CFH S0078 TaxID=1644108 RepID=UPI00106E9F69|nr:helix-turn-helix transcriptional regulator [Amycolatopsis sp. CFH S0078]
MDITSDQAAQLLGIQGGSLRQIELNVKPVSLALAFRAERLYGVAVDELIDESKDEPNKTPEPKPQPKIERVAPPRRQEREPSKGPRRAQDVA